MGSLVHTGLGSSSLVAHVLPYPPPPHANSFVLGPAVINTHTPAAISHRPYPAREPSVLHNNTLKTRSPTPSWCPQQHHHKARCVVTTKARFVAFLGTLPALLNRSGCRATTSRIQPAPPSGAGDGNAANSVATPEPQHAGSQDNGNGKLVLPQLNHLQAAFKRSQVSPLCLPALRTISPLGPAPFCRNAVSRSSSPSNNPNSRPYVNTTLARVVRSSARSKSLRS
jgi:hypothetical protein